MSNYGLYGETPDWFTRTIKNIGKGFSDFGRNFAGAYGQAQVSRGGFGLGEVMEPGLFNQPETPRTYDASLGGTAGESARFAGLAPGSLGGTPGEERRYRDYRSGERARYAPDGELPTEEQGGGGGGGPSVSSVFAPLFDALDQQRRNAESRYSANAGQIQNIYGQIIGARTADIGDIEEAYSRLQQAAASRGESTLGKIQQREQQRQARNQAMMQSMGISDIGGATDDVAAQAAKVAQDVEMMNQSNWAGMLDAMGATSQELARADIASYGYRQGEDIARLQAAKEDYLQNVAEQEFQLKFQEQQAKFEAAQAAAAAQARAEQDAAEAAAKAEEQQFEMSLDYIKTLPPIQRALGEEALYRGLSPADQASAEAAYSTFLANEGTRLGRMGMTAQEALAVINSPDYAGQLSEQAKYVLSKAILYTFSQ